MYQNQSSPGQWNNQSGTPTSQSAPNWSPHPPAGQYAPRPNQIPPISQALPPQQPAGQMPTMQPQHPDQYRQLPPPPPHMYGPPYQQPPMGYPPQQPAPRQRTAIACRYCRRRKIRCSGFDQSEDGRCTNCQRFSQECIFTPVSAQTQAFVPAHTVWRGQNPPQGAQLFGAYGQPLPQQGGRDPYPQPQQQPGQYPPPPQGYQQPQMYGQPPQAGTPQAGQKRGTDEPHTPTLPPSNPGAQADMPQHPYPYGGLPTGASHAPYPASFTFAPQTYHYGAQQPPHASSQSAPSYEGSRASASPHKHGQPVTSAPTSRSNSSQPGGDGTNYAEAQKHSIEINELVGPTAKQTAQAALKWDEYRTSTDTNHAGNPIPPTSTKTLGVDAGVQTIESSMSGAKEQAS